MHVLLLGGLLVGNPFRAEPLPMNVQDVSVITSEQFAALTAPQAAPEVATDVALPEPEPAPEPEPLPEPDTPEPEPAPTPQPEDLAALEPDNALDEPPAPAERVAPEPVPEPEPEAAPDDTAQEAVSEDAQSDVQQEAQEQTAPEAATTEIVTEADETSTAPLSSPRPPSYLAQKPHAAEAEEPEPSPEPEPEDSVADAIAGAVAEAQETPVPTGPPLTGGEREGLKVAVASCWNVGALSSEAQETKVTVFVAMNRDGTPDTGSIRMMSASGGSDASARRVFETARRAIIRCGARGFPLPVEKYAQWREIEMTFNPEGMFWR